MAHITEAGARHNAADMQVVQTIHDHAMALGAACKEPDADDAKESLKIESLTEAAPLKVKDSHDATRQAVSKALNVDHGVSPYSEQAPRIRDMFPDHVVYDHQGKTLKRKYSVETSAAGEPKVSLMGPTSQVDVAYVASPTLPGGWSEASKFYFADRAANNDSIALTEGPVFEADDAALVEAAKTQSPTVKVKLIAPGWGSSGHYSAEVLKRDGPKVFTSGTHMYWNHATEAEDKQRPEGDIDKLAAVLTGNAYWDDNGKHGPGLYAESKVFSDYAAKVTEKGPHIGVSIRAYGKAKPGEIDGRKGNIVEALTVARSTDFVTKAGAGGKVLTESARDGGQENAGSGEPTKEQQMNEAEIKALREAQAETADELQRIRNARIRTEAREIVSARLTESTLPQAAKRKLTESLVATVPTKDKEIDTASFTSRITEAIKAEGDYITELRGGSPVRGMGAAPLAESGEMKEEDFEKQLRESFIAQGMTEAAAGFAAKAGR